MLPRGGWTSTRKQAFLMPQPAVSFTSVSGTLRRVQASHLCLLIQELISDEIGLFQVHRGSCVSVHV